jgi:ABC-type branched-subunit amino acid transport system substrate-binding protein
MKFRAFAAGIICLLSGLLCLSEASISAAFAEPGVDKGNILLGQAAVLEGHAMALGRDMRNGLLAAFAEANRSGGVKGRRIELISRNDGYEPGKSIEVTKKLIEDDKVFALVGAVGTPTSKVSLPVATENGVPFIGAFTGADFLRDPFNPKVVNVRASYLQETEVLVDRLVKDRGISRIAILYQDDAFGRSGLTGVAKALDKRAMKLVSEGTFERNTTAVKTALLAIRRGNPEAVIMISPYKPCAEFVKLARQLNWYPLFMTISFAGSNALADELGPDGAGIVASQVVPCPLDPSLPIIARYQAALKFLDPTLRPGCISLEGYLVGRLVVAALESSGEAPTRQAFLDSIFGHSFDFGGFRLTYDPDSNQGSSEVALTVIQSDGSHKPIKTLDQ